MPDTISPLLGAIGISTIWVAIEGFRSGWRAVHLHWVIINGIYLLGLVLAKCVTDQGEGILQLLYAIFLGVQVLDFLLSRSLAFLEKL